MDLRCPHKFHGRMLEPAPGGIFEVKCGSDFCGARAGVVVLHRFDTGSGELVETRKFKDTPRVKRRNSNALGQRTAIRIA